MAVPAKYSGVDFKPPESVAEVAQRALAWRAEGNRGGTAVGVARGVQLAGRRVVAPDTIKRMVSFFARHEVDRKAEGFRRGEDGYPSPGRVAWDLWGGDRGRAWARKIQRAMRRADLAAGPAANDRTRRRRSRRRRAG